MDWTDGELDFWYSDYMPATKAEFLAMSSTEMVDMMANPAYHQPQSPLSGIYTETGVLGTAEAELGMFERLFGC
jgi:hypothetical protein